MFHTYHVPDDAIDCTCSGFGWIDEVPAFIVRITERDDAGVIRGDLYGCIVSLSRSSGFVVWDWRNIPPAEHSMKNSLHEGYDMSLTIEFGSGARCDLSAVKFGHESGIPE